jgi:hypothetical protein
MLDLPPARVRDLARDALGELAPYTAELVDSQWRGQLADYVLGQQTGPESKATRGHLRRSEPARMWAYSLLDALDDFFEDGARPEIPVGESGGSVRSRAKEREPRSNGEAPAAGPLAAPARARRASRGTMTPAARSALLRRRILGGLAAAVVLALLVFGALKLFGGDDDNNKGATPAETTAAQTPRGQGTVAAQAVLSPIGKTKGRGAALVYTSGQQGLVVVRATLPPSTGKNKYVVWLYNSEKQLQPLAADVTNKKGDFQGAAQLPQNWQSYKFIDVTYQPTSGKAVRHQNSVMRGPLTAPQTGTGTTGPQ